jgi:hypothetical protein
MPRCYQAVAFSALAREGWLEGGRPFATHCMRNIVGDGIEGGEAKNK